MKYINADKLKQEMIGRWSFREESSIFKLIDELSEERESIPTLEAINKTRGKDYTNGGLVNEPLKVAIKGDGTEEYGKKIIEYFEKLGVPNINGFSCRCEKVYYFIHRNNMLHWEYDLPEGYTEISLKEDDKPTNN